LTPSIRERELRHDLAYLRYQFAMGRKTDLTAMLQLPNDYAGVDL
jgi:hypothetical protein